MAAQKGFLNIVNLLLSNMKNVKLSPDSELLIECLQGGEEVILNKLH